MKKGCVELCGDIHPTRRQKATHNGIESGLSGRGTYAPVSPFIIHFHAVFGKKIKPNNRLAPPLFGWCGFHLWEIQDPPLAPLLKCTEI